VEEIQMRDNFDKAFDLLMEMEGYESNDPDDKGGPTKYGIASVFNPDIKLQDLTREGAKQIYLDRYWIPAGCDDYDYPFDMVMFIQCVNLGIGRAEVFMDKSKGLFDFFMLNLNHYCSREKSQRDKYLSGWCNRLLKLWRAL
jgi:lysozyme family protein